MKSMVRFGLHAVGFSVTYTVAKRWTGWGWACSTGPIKLATIKTQ